MSSKQNISESSPWSTEEAKASIVQRRIQQLAEEKEHKRTTRRQCSYCLKKSPKSLPTCSLCKSVSYCNKICQMADYKRSHKRECAEFLHPPFVADFTPEPLGDTEYDRNPIFARGHDTGIGCWVSVGGRVDAQLSALAEHIMPPPNPQALTVRSEMISRDRALAARMRVYEANLLTLDVVVQNRRKDGADVAVFPAQAMLQSHAGPESIAALAGGRVEGERIAIFNSAEGECVMMVPVRDPWSKNPRVFLNTLDSMSNSADLPSLSGVLDPATGSVLLKPGQFALYHIQFRVGDSTRVYSEWHALRYLSQLYLPVKVPWLSVNSVDATERTIAERFGRASGAPTGVPVSFNQAAIANYYRDYIV